MKYLNTLLVKKKIINQLRMDKNAGTLHCYARSAFFCFVGSEIEPDSQ